MIAYMVGGNQLDMRPYSTGIVAIFAYDRLCGINIRLCQSLVVVLLYETVIWAYPIVKPAITSLTIHLGL